jgi:hypothetical protein
VTTRSVSASKGTAVGSGGAKEDERLFMILANSSLAQPPTGHGVRGIDPGMYRQARRGDGPIGVELRVSR